MFFFCNSIFKSTFLFWRPIHAPSWFIEFHHLFQRVSELSLESYLRSNFFLTRWAQNKSFSKKVRLWINLLCLRVNIFIFGKREWKSVFNKLIPVHGMPLLKVLSFLLKNWMVNYYLNNGMKWEIMRKEKCKMINKLKIF